MLREIVAELTAREDTDAKGQKVDRDGLSGPQMFRRVSGHQCFLF